MTDEEIIEMRIEYENAVWRSFGETIAVMPDIREARACHNTYCAALYEELPPEVVTVLRPWQRPS